jgi:hypothetical protein
MAGIVLGEVPTEAPGRPVEVTGPRRQIEERDAIAAGRHVPPHGTEHPVRGEAILARHVQREGAWDLHAHGGLPEAGGDILFALVLWHDDEEVREPGEVPLAVQLAASRT